jgi:hypothetical protein
MAVADMVDVVRILTGLLTAERGSVFRFVGQAEPYVGRTGVGIRRAVGELAAASVRHEAEQGEMIEELGGTVQLAGVVPDNQYLAFLSLDFLRPRLVEEAKKAVGRYEGALALVGQGDETVREMLKRQRGDYARFVEQACG